MPCLYNVAPQWSINISYSYQKGHFEYLVPVSCNQGHFIHESIITGLVDLENKTFFDGSYYNYITRAETFMAHNKDTLFYCSAGIAIAGQVLSHVNNLVFAEDFSGNQTRPV